MLVWCWWGWQTKTSGDPLGPRPDQFRPIHFDLLHLLDFCAFNDIDAKYFVLYSFSCKRTFEIEYNFWHNTFAQCLGLSEIEWFSGSQGVARSSWWDT